MLNRSTVNKSFNPCGKETATFQTKAYYVTDIGTVVFRHHLTSALSSLSKCIASQNAALRGDENCIELRDRSHLCYKSIINYDRDIANFLVISPQIRYIEVFDLTNKFGRSPASSLNRGSTVNKKPAFSKISTCRKKRRIKWQGSDVDILTTSNNRPPGFLMYKDNSTISVVIKRKIAFCMVSSTTSKFFHKIFSIRQLTACPNTLFSPDSQSRALISK